VVRGREIDGRIGSLTWGTRTSASPWTGTGHLMPDSEDEAAALLDSYLARASEQVARASLAPLLSGSDRIASDLVGPNLP
jgi:hypothetical protein